MKIKFPVILLIAAMLVVGLSACERSASKAPDTTATAAGELPFPLPVTTDNAMKNILAGTQTAAASQNPGVPAQQGTQAVGSGSSPTLPPLVLPTDTVVAPVYTPTAAPTFVTVASPTPGYPSSYTIHQGEWPFCLARRFNIDPAALLAANGLTLNSRPDPGSVLTIPADAAKWSSGSRDLVTHPAVYVVKTGDTVYSIACDFGDADPNAIIAANNLQAPYTLTAGASIQVP